MKMEPGRLCVHTITTKPLGLERAVEAYEALGIGGISVWREAAAEMGIEAAGRLLRQSSLRVVSYVRGGFFASATAEERRKAIDHNKRMLDEAAVIGAPMMVLVCGSDARQTLETSRHQIREGIELLLPHAESLGIRLGIEPLHPMYADTRSAINTMKQANDLAAAIGSPQLGVVVDVYHVWWDGDLESEIMRCGREGRLFAFHVCDWRVPTGDLLNDRGLMGEGCIPLKLIRQWVEAAGFDGFIEVEIFSEHYWKREQAGYLQEIKKAFLRHV